MKKVKSLNGYSIFEASPRDVDKYGYKAGSPEPEDLAELLPMADHLNRSASADCVALEMLTSYKRKLLDRALDELCEELTAAAALSTSTKPAKGGERHGNSSKTRR